MPIKLHKVSGQPSWILASDQVRAFITRRGGHLGPVTFSLSGRKIEPFSVAPWAEERLPKRTPSVLKVLRGDFLCCPFGVNARIWRGEKHPPHGETASAVWKLEKEQHEKNVHSLHLSMSTKVRPCRIEKKILLHNGHNALYCQHTILGMSGPMPLGHHAMLQFPQRPGSGLLTTSPFVFGKVCDGLDASEARTPSALRPGADFTRLDQVPTVNGRLADLSQYPARRGFDDLVMLIGKPDLPFAWTAVTFPRQRYVWFALKNPSVLRYTILWFSNGGRRYAPWNGRHEQIMGLEEVTAYFHHGLAESVKKNFLNQSGFPTTIELSKKRPLTVRYVMAVQSIPPGFDRVSDIRLCDGQAVLHSRSGKQVAAPMDTTFIQSQAT
jgi:hypothetical protein